MKKIIIFFLLLISITALSAQDLFSGAQLEERNTLEKLFVKEVTKTNTQMQAIRLVGTIGGIAMILSGLPENTGVGGTDKEVALAIGGVGLSVFSWNGIIGNIATPYKEPISKENAVKNAAIDFVKKEGGITFIKRKAKKESRRIVEEIMFSY